MAFDLLADPDWRQAANTDARGADMLVISTVSGSDLPVNVKHWLTACLTRKCGRLGASPNEQDGKCEMEIISIPPTSPIFQDAFIVNSEQNVLHVTSWRWLELLAVPKPIAESNQDLWEARQ